MKKHLLIVLFLLCCLVYKTPAQSSSADSVKTELQGAWRMDDDTNVVLLFKGDSMVHHMMRTSGAGRVRFRITDKSCDTTRFTKNKAWYIEETYRYYQYKTALDGKLCNKIVYLKNNMLILKRDGLFEDYSKLRYIPTFKQ